MISPVTVPPSPEAQPQHHLFLRRIWALALRHIYLYLESWPRLIEIGYWPMVNMLVWGFTASYLMKTIGGVSVLSTVLLGGVILSELMMRSGFSIMILFIEEFWSRNLGHLFASPLTFIDYICALVLLGFFRTALAITPAIFLAKYLFGFGLWSFGLPLIAFLALLFINGCSVGLLVISVLLRYGLAAEWIGWMLVFGFVPLVAPYYPVTILPHALQLVSWSLPATYVFETMKIMINTGELRMDYLVTAAWLNIVWFLIATGIFYAAFQSARRRGGLLQVGE